jgi:hypothetical protein
MGDWLPTRIVIAVSDDWLFVGIVTLAIILGAWKLIAVLRRAP